MSNSSFGFVIRPFRGLKGRLLFAELSPDGRVIGTGFTEIEAADGSPLLNLEKDQVVLVSYQLDKDQVKYAVVNSWFVTSSFIGKLLNSVPFLVRFESAIRHILPSSLKSTYRRGEIVPLLNFLFTTVAKENLRPFEEAEVNRNTQQMGGIMTSLPQTS